tara:strand:- start:4130 stop:4828 length:699 start_codon:yes stop_codon:yes gene_type:complete
VGFFDRFRRRARLAPLAASWTAPPLLDSLRAAALPDGSLPPGFELPRAPVPAADLERVLAQMTDRAADAQRAAEVARRVVALTRDTMQADLEALEARLAASPLLPDVDAVVRALRATPDLDGDRVHELGTFLATRAPAPELVKLGLTLLGMVEGPDDRDVLLSLGAHPDLTIFVVVAMTNRPDLGERELFDLARRTRGESRLQVVERLADTRDPAVRTWLVREGYLTGPTLH